MTLTLCFIVILFDVVSCRRAAADPTRIVGLTGIHFVEREDTLLDIARAHGLGILELMAANPGVDPWIPDEGRRILLPLWRILPDAPERGMIAAHGEDSVRDHDDALAGAGSLAQ